MSSIYVGVDVYCIVNSQNSPRVRESKIVLDSGFQVLDSSFLSVEFGFWIPIVCGIPDSLSYIPDSKAQDFGFHK